MNYEDNNGDRQGWERALSWYGLAGFIELTFPRAFPTTEDGPTFGSNIGQVFTIVYINGYELVLVLMLGILSKIAILT
jgi:hypothetical protein